MRSESFVPTTVGGVGVLLLLVNLLTSGHEQVGQLALGLILFSITLALIGKRA